jgi:hypothetical protein
MQALTADPSGNGFVTMMLAARMYSSNDIISAILLSLRKLLSTIIFLAWIHKMLYAENTDFVRGDSYKTGL